MWEGVEELTNSNAYIHQSILFLKYYFLILNMQFPKIRVVKIIKKYLLHVEFNDGTEGVYDVSHLAGKGIFATWDVDNNFDKVFISEKSGAITWPGELDNDTINIYCKIKGIEVEEYLNRKRYATHL